MDDLISRLAAYEDLDAEPEEIADVLAFCKKNGLKNLVGLLNAIATDRVIVLPCKVGEVVRCGACAHSPDGHLCFVHAHADETRPDGYCYLGVRRRGDAGA